MGFKIPFKFQGAFAVGEAPRKARKPVYVSLRFATLNYAGQSSLLHYVAERRLAEGVGFEPTDHFMGGRSISSRVPSTTQPPLRLGNLLE